jgi:hypothetical protein
LANNLNTGEFDPGIKNRNWGNTVSAFNSQLWVIGAGDGDQVYQSIFTFSGHAGDWALTNSKNWPTYPAAVQGTDPIITQNKCGSDVLGDGSALYLFWNSGSAPTGIRGASTSGASTGAPYWNGFVLQDSSGNSVAPRGSGCDISAVAYGSGAFLLAFPIEQDDAAAIFIGLYTIGGQQTQTSVPIGNASYIPWPAQAQAVITCDMLTGYAQSGTPNSRVFLDVNKSISIAWFASSPASGGDAQVLLMASLTATLQQEPSNVSWPVQLLLQLDPTSGTPLPANAPAPIVMFDDVFPGSPLFTVKDPANRVICYAMSGQQGIERWQYSTWATPTEAPPVTMDVTVDHSDDYSPAVAFYIDTNNPIAPVPPVTTNPDGSTLAYNVYRFVFYNASYVYAQASYYGQVEQMPSQILQPDQTVESILVTGIFDSPFPEPLQNAIGFQFESDNPSMGDFTFTNAAGATTGYTQSVSGAAGLHTEGVFNCGLAWNVTLLGGGQSTWGTLTTTTVTEALAQHAIMNTNNQKIGFGVNPYAVVLGASPRLIQVPYRFVDADGTIIGYPYSTPDTDQAPRASTITVVQTLAESYDYVPYMVTPGDLWSYTPEKINSTMAALYAQAGWPVPDDYFHDVLLQNAAQIGGSPYLSFTLNQNSSLANTFSRVVQNDKTWGWNTSLSAFVGYGWNATIGGEEISQGQIGAQLTFSAQGNWEADSTNDIGISVANLQFPIWDDSTADGYAAAVCNYVVLLLYLPPPPAASSGPAPTLWADELRQFWTPQVPLQIDGGSEPWRIAFVVIAFQTNQNIGKGWDYQYAGNLPGSPTMPSPM